MDIDEFKKTIKFAIAGEVEAQIFYKEVSKAVESPQLKDMFMEFSEDEKQHAQILKGYLSKDPESFQFDGSNDYKYSETVDKPKLSLSMHPADAFAFAMKNEEEAVELYTKLSEIATDPMIKKTFQELANMERGHKTKMENSFKNVTFSADWGM
jgi:rubrerythrin